VPRQKILHEDPVVNTYFDNACDASNSILETRVGVMVPDVLKFRCITHPRPFINHIVDTQVKRDIVISETT
jgi:hypothetical protein